MNWIVDILPRWGHSSTANHEWVRFVRQREHDSEQDVRIRATVDRLIVELLVFSGLRNSELCHLRVADTAIGHGISAVQVAGTPRQDRLVFIPRSLSNDLVLFVERVRPASVSEETRVDDASQPLFLNERGRPYDRTALYRRVIRILTEAGLEERASVQLLRHTYGFLAYKRTRGNLLFVQRQLGHAHPMVTAVYAQFVQFSDTELADLVSNDAPPAKPIVERPAKLTRAKGKKR